MLPAHGITASGTASGLSQSVSSKLRCAASRGHARGTLFDQLQEEVKARGCGEVVLENAGSDSSFGR